MEIHGGEHALTMPAEVERDGRSVHATAHFDVPFVEWGMHDPSILFLRVEKTVAVTVETEGHLSDGAAEADGDGMGAAPMETGAKGAGQGGR